MGSSSKKRAAKDDLRGYTAPGPKKRERCFLGSAIAGSKTSQGILDWAGHVWFAGIYGKNDGKGQTVRKMEATYYLPFYLLPTYYVLAYEGK